MTLSKDVQTLKESLGELPEPAVNPPFVVVSGLPGTGKSYFCRKLAERLPFPILESDNLRKVLSSNPDYGAEESNRLFQACHCLIEELLRRGIPLIFDATNLVERNREHLYRIADTVEAKLILVRVEAPPDVVRQRLNNRSSTAGRQDRSDADWRVYRKMKSSAQRIRRNHFAVDTSRDISPVVDKVVREASR
jgi:predicted kinase